MARNLLQPLSPDGLQQLHALTDLGEGGSLVTGPGATRPVAANALPQGVRGKEPLSLLQHQITFFFFFFLFCVAHLQGWRS